MTARAFAETPKLLRFPVRVRARRETRELWRDVAVLLRALLAAHAAYVRAIQAEAIDAARAGTPLLHNWDALARLAERIAEILAAAEIAGRLRTRRQAEEASTPETPRGPMSAFAETFPRSIPPSKAIEYLRSLDIVTRSMWEAFVTQYRQPAFTIAGIENEAVLRDLRNLVARSLEEGWSEARFEAEARKRLGEFELTGRHLRTVWNMNVSNALRAGRYAELAEPEVARVLNWWLFDSVIDGVVRPNHAALDNGVAPVNWPGWQVYGDPLGFNCRCARIAIREDLARRMIASGEAHDLTVSVPELAGPDPGFRKVL